MNGIKHETQVWYCDLCDKTITVKSKSRHINSKIHKQQEKYGTVVKEYNFTNSDIDEVNYTLNDTIQNRRNNYFPSFEHRCV